MRLWRFTLLFTSASQRYLEHPSGLDPPADMIPQQALHSLVTPEVLDTNPQSPFEDHASAVVLLSLGPPDPGLSRRDGLWLVKVFEDYRC
jgi:hypothetical protein